jgi:tight adherence protein C
MGMVDLITLATFVCVMAAVWLLFRAMFRPRPTLVASHLLGDGPAKLGFGQEDAVNAWIESLAAQLPQSLLGDEELDKDLRRAGYYRASARKRLLAFRNGLTIFAVIATGGLAVWIGPQNQRAVWWTLGIGLVVAILCYALPRVALAINAKNRVARIGATLPDALDTVSMCLQSGISLQECLMYVGREMMAVHPDLALELMMVGHHADINSFEFAFQQFANRIDSPEVMALASMVVQNQRLGTGVVDAIREFADNLRLKRRQLAEMKAGRVELFLLFPTVFCLVPSVILLLWSPPILSLINFVQGPASQIKVNP